LNRPFDDADRRFMREALRLAERGRGTTRPNPVVGALVVKAGTVLARGFHKRAGQAHAEIVALSKLGMRAPGATLYVTLEPCCHQGRTGPCTTALLAAGIRRVVVGCCDENPLVSGRGIALLRRSGLDVSAGCLKEECYRQNRAFFTWVRRQRPWITLKVASTLDGFIGDRRERERKGQARWITSAQARVRAHELRAEHDAVLVGVGTVLADDPLLTVRTDNKAARQPLRIVLDSQLRTPPNAALMATSRDHARPLIIAAEPRVRQRGLARRQRQLEDGGAEVLFVRADRHGHVALPAVLQALAGREIQSLLVEGGSTIHGAFISQRLVDSVALFLAPRLVGHGVPVVEGAGLDWNHPAKLGPLNVEALGPDLLVTADVIDAGKARHSSQK
jgi:diaminohydroxyphosphoribosylaminopyrimidine deaminase / 5-amino-6-(5-phosphoribosylamino)uracil reductase